MSGGKLSQRMAGKSPRKRVSEMLEGEEPGLSLKREGWMSLWKNRQKKWSSRGAFSTSQKALRRNREICYFLYCCLCFQCHSGGGGGGAVVVQRAASRPHSSKSASMLS